MGSRESPTRGRNVRTLCLLKLIRLSALSFFCYLNIPAAITINSWMECHVTPAYIPTWNVGIVEQTWVQFVLEIVEQRSLCSTIVFIMSHKLWKFNSGTQPAHEYYKVLLNSIK